LSHSLLLRSTKKCAPTNQCVTLVEWLDHNEKIVRLHQAIQREEKQVEDALLFAAAVAVEEKREDYDGWQMQSECPNEFFKTDEVRCELKKDSFFVDSVNNPLGSRLDCFSRCILRRLVNR
jgi:hypothetical protein